MKNRTKQLMALFLTTSLCAGPVTSVGTSTAVFAAEAQTEAQSTAEQESAEESSETVSESGSKEESSESADSGTPEGDNSQGENANDQNSAGTDTVGTDNNETAENAGSEAESTQNPENSGEQGENSGEQGEAAQNPEATVTPTGAEKEEISETEEKEKKEEETKEETVKAALVITDASGNAVPVEEIAGPQQLTVGGITYPVNYAQGIHHVYVPEGTESIQITVPDQKDGEQISLTKWGGYVTESEQTWLLHPDAPIEGGYTAAGNVYTVNLEKYALVQEQITAEQTAVYGCLEPDIDYAEIFVSGEDRSEVILVEYIQDVTQVSVLSATAAETKQSYTAAGKNLADSAQKYIPTVSSINGEWQILGLARSDASVNQDVYDKYLKNVINTVKENNGVLHAKKYTEYSRVILALTSLGYDVTNVGGYNLLQPLADFDQTVWQGVNGAVFALIAFDSHDYEIPTAESGKTQNSRDKLIEHILDQEISGGGWALSGKTPDSDMTAMALQSLAPYYATNPDVKKAVDRGIAKLSAIQKSDGSFATYGSKTSESCAQVVVALTALGIDPNKDSRFIKNGKSVLEALLAFQQPDGSFKHVMNGDSNQMATEQAYYALTAYERFTNGKTSLYDMTDVILPSDKTKAEAVETLIKALPSTITLADKDQVELTWSKYNALNKTQKGLISEASLKKLQDASAALKNLDSSWKEPEKENNNNNNKTDKNDKTDNKKENTGSDKKPSSGNKVVGGTTKQVNLVSGSSKSTGGTVSGGTTSSAKDSSKEKEDDAEEKEDSQKTSKTDKKVKNLKTKINKLFRGSGKLPDDPKDFTEKQTEEILDIYRTYTGFSDSQKKEIEKTGNYKKYQKILEQLKTENHYDTASGTDVSDNEEELLPWYVRLEVNEIGVEQDKAEAVKEALDGQGELLTMSEISLEDLLEGESWQPEDLIRVSIPMTDLGEYEQVAVVHLKDDGSMEFLTAHIAGKNLEFDTDHFSKFGVVGYNGTMAELMQEQDNENPWIYFVPGIGAALLLIVLFMRRIAGSAKKKDGDGSER